MPIPRKQLAGTLDRFLAGLSERFSRAAFRQIRATSPDRAEGAEADRHRLAALSSRGTLAWRSTQRGSHVFSIGTGQRNAATEAYVILHEVAHFALAPRERRGLIDFGLGPGPDTIDRDPAEATAVVSPLEREQDEAAASLLGILWEASFGQPALASFLDRNWLEGLDRSAPAHFATVLLGLRDRGLFNLRSRHKWAGWRGSRDRIWNTNGQTA